MKCERCHKETNTTICSMFNTQMICMECKTEEQKHPLYAEAKRVEHEEVVRGNHDFEGIGLPSDLVKGRTDEKE